MTSVGLLFLVVGLIWIALFPLIWRLSLDPQSRAAQRRPNLALLPRRWRLLYWLPAAQIYVAWITTIFWRPPRAVAVAVILAAGALGLAMRIPIRAGIRQRQDEQQLPQSEAHDHRFPE